MGGSGGGYFEHRSPKSIQDDLRREEQTTDTQVFETKVSTEIASLLADYNDRDAVAVSAAIDTLRKALEAEIEDISINPVFGGSVRKHTYVNGISDIDSLFVLKDEGLAQETPEVVLDHFESALRARLPNRKIQRDNIALGVTINDLKIEVLPAVRKGDKLAISSTTGQQWSKITPEAFFKKLSEVNSRQGSKVVPCIKMVKGVIDGFPDAQKLRGYHVESLAIEAFKSYQGPQNTKAMIEHFFTFASDRVLQPIRDKSGQSLHVDGYAGPRNSETRRLMSQSLDRVARRIKNANASQSVDHWVRILDQESE
jgi:hypothetical protein